MIDVGRLNVATRRGDLLAVAGAGRSAPVAVHDLPGLIRRGVIRTRFPVRALAFHPVSPLLAIGGGAYDGGYVFEGELLLWDLAAPTAISLFEHPAGREVLGLEWINDQDLRVRIRPPDDQDAAEAYVAVLHRSDWRTVPPGSIRPDELDGSPIPMPRVATAKEARDLLNSLT